ncbi:MAG TPA: hypothetical protein VHX86_14900 [Tepidisphaeraceae bacterium]|jgi:hypothetical protein|nr:hypothetical protein [Tepidisphaeraceae bacterium]
MSGNDYFTNVTRPGILTAVGVFSIIVASTALLVDLGSLGFANAVSHFAVRRTPAATINSAPPPLTPAHAEYVAPNGLSASQRQIVIAGLSQVRPLSIARQKQVDGLLADAGQQVIGLSPDNLTTDRVVAYVTDVRNFPNASGGPPDDLFILGSGRLQVSDENAVFFAQNSPSGIRSHGGSFTDSSGTHLASEQIAAVVDRVQSLCGQGQAMNSAQINALQSELELPSQTLITPSASVAEAAAQVQSVRALGDGTIAVTTGNSSMSFGPRGRMVPGVIAISQTIWTPPMVAKRDATLLVLDTFLSFVAAGFLLACGVMVLRNSPISRWMHLGYAIGKIPLVALSCFAIYQVAMALNARSPDAESTANAWMMIVGMPGIVYPIVLLIVMNLRSVREFLGTPTVARIF